MDALSRFRRLSTVFSDDYLVILTADHGGHDSSHGTDRPEDMTIPIIFYNKQFTRKDLGDATIMDIAPTIAAVLGVEADRDWEGHALEI